jgi:hypothetical protein
MAVSPKPHHRVAFADFERRKDLCAVVSQAAHEDVTVFDELGYENLVPEIDELGFSRRCVGRAHDRCLARCAEPARIILTPPRLLV